ncbi:ABC transporter ATP-binding protein [Candidatus Bipolaricaulota bacterium]
MTNVAIRVENLSKKYRIGHVQEHYRTLRDTLANAAKGPIRRLRSFGQSSHREEDTIWALKNVSFEVNQGKVVGIIGRNGSGKSTLLKILSRITEPTEGRAEIHGRVGSLLEVGTGFHQELTGRENVYLSGRILGMPRREIDRKFDEIIAFAGVDKFIDTPVKRYSSGMSVRLGFAVAAHLEPEILLIDEVLAVGDVEFQKKCLGKMGEVASEGRTVLFVSHNIAAVQNLCTSGITLEQGRIIFHGTQHEAVKAYLQSVDRKQLPLSQRVDRRGSGELVVKNIGLRDSDGNPIDILLSGQAVEFVFEYECSTERPLTRVLAGLTIKNLNEVPVFMLHNRLTGDDFGALPPRGAFICRVANFPLPEGVYKLGFSVMPNLGLSGDYIDIVEDAVELTVKQGNFFATGEVPPASDGVCLVNGQWWVERADVREVTR